MAESKLTETSGRAFTRVKHFPNHCMLAPYEPRVSADLDGQHESNMDTQQYIDVPYRLFEQFHVLMLLFMWLHIWYSGFSSAFGIIKLILLSSRNHYGQ